MADGDTAEVELEEIRCGNRVFSGSSAPALHEHPINKDLIAHFKSKGDSVSWGIAEMELEEIRYRNRVFSGRSAPALHKHPINKVLIAHFKRKGDSVSWGIAESIEKYEEDTEKKVSRGTDIAALYDQETERELAKEVENRIEEALSAIDPGRVVMADGDTVEVELEGCSAPRCTNIP